MSGHFISRIESVADDGVSAFIRKNEFEETLEAFRSRDVYQPMLTRMGGPPQDFDELPAYIYCYIIRFDQNGQLDIKQYLYWEEGTSGNQIDRVRIAYASVPAKIQYIYSKVSGSWPNSVQDGRNRIVSFGGDFYNINNWNRLSYFSIFINHTNWIICDGSGAEPPAMEFQHGGQNKCFFDGRNVVTSIGGADRHLFYCVNHFRDKNGRRFRTTDAPTVKEDFKWDLYTKFHFGDGVPDVYIVFDPGGSNGGPANPPPGDN